MRSASDRSSSSAVFVDKWNAASSVKTNHYRSGLSALDQKLDILESQLKGRQPDLSSMRSRKVSELSSSAFEPTHYFEGQISSSASSLFSSSSHGQSSLSRTSSNQNHSRSVANSSDHRRVKMHFESLPHRMVEENWLYYTLVPILTGEKLYVRLKRRTKVYSRINFIRRNLVSFLPSGKYVRIFGIISNGRRYRFKLRHHRYITSRRNHVKLLILVQH